MHDYTTMTAHADAHRRDAHERANAGRIAAIARAARSAAAPTRSPSPTRRPLTWFRTREAGGPA